MTLLNLVVLGLRRQFTGCAIGVLLAMVSVTAHAQDVNGPSAQAIQDEIHRAVAGSIIEYDVPGAVAAIILPNGEEIIVPVGCVDRACISRMPAEAIMRGGSTGKSYLGALALSLVLDDRLDLDNPIREYLPDAPWLRKLAYGEQFTMRHLLMHTSGLDDWPKIPEAIEALNRQIEENPDASFTPLELISFSFNKPALFSPGTGFSYSDTGYLLAGLVVEALSGERYYDAVRRLFIEPFDLDYTRPQTTRRVEGLVQGHMGPENTRGLPSELVGPDGQLIYNPGYEWTGGGFFTNARDLARWGRVYCSGKALPKDYLSIVKHNLATWDEIRKYGFGLIYSEDEEFGARCAHGGWTPGYLSEFRHYSESNLTIAVQLNGVGNVNHNTTDLTGPWPQFTAHAIELAIIRLGLVRPSREPDEG